MHVYKLNFCYISHQSSSELKYPLLKIIKDIYNKHTCIFIDTYYM